MPRSTIRVRVEVELPLPSSHSSTSPAIFRRLIQIDRKETLTIDSLCSYIFDRFDVSRDFSSQPIKIFVQGFEVSTTETTSILRDDDLIQISLCVDKRFGMNFPYLFGSKLSSPIEMTSTSSLRDSNNYYISGNSSNNNTNSSNNNTNSSNNISRHTNNTNITINNSSSAVDRQEKPTLLRATEAGSINGVDVGCLWKLMQLDKSKKKMKYNSNSNSNSIMECLESLPNRVTFLEDPYRDSSDLTESSLINQSEQGSEPLGDNASAERVSKSKRRRLNLIRKRKAGRDGDPAGDDNSGNSNSNSNSNSDNSNSSDNIINNRDDVSNSCSNSKNNSDYDIYSNSNMDNNASFADDEAGSDLLLLLSSKLLQLQ